MAYQDNVANKVTSTAGNVAAPGAKTSGAHKRIPMSTPQQRLEVPPIPGFHLYWFLESRVERAIQGGYVYVDAREVALNQRTIGAPGDTSGSTDMGSRVSVIAGTGADGQPERLYLMKIQQEWYDEDRAVLEARNKQTEDSIRGGSVGTEELSLQDRKQRYVKTADLKTSNRK